MEQQASTEIIVAPSMETTQESAVRVVEEVTEGDDKAKVIATIYAGAVPIVYVVAEAMCAINHVPLVIHEHYLLTACILGFLSILKWRRKQN